MKEKKYLLRKRSKMIYEEQMHLLQYCAQQLLVHLKEDKNWEKYCEKYRVLPKEKKLETAQHLASTDVCNKSKTSTLDIQSINRRLDKLVLDLNSWKEREDNEVKLKKIEIAAETDDFRTANQLNEIQRDRLQNLQFKLKKLISHRYSHFKTVPTESKVKQKGVGFLLPYALREERALAKRAYNRSLAMRKLQKKCFASTIKNVTSPKRNSRLPVPDRKGIWDYTSEEEDEEFSDTSNTESLLFEMNTKLNSIRSCSQRLNEIKVTEENVREKWNTPNGNDKTSQFNFTKIHSFPKIDSYDVTKSNDVICPQDDENPNPVERFTTFVLSSESTSDQNEQQLKNNIEGMFGVNDNLEVQLFLSHIWYVEENTKSWRKSDHGKWSEHYLKNMIFRYHIECMS